MLKSGIGVVFPSTQYFYFLSRPIFRYLLRVSPNNLDVLPGADVGSSARRGAGLPWGGTWGEPYCPLSSAVCNATIPTLPLFEVAKCACSPFCYVFHYFLFIKFISLFSHVCVTGQFL